LVKSILAFPYNSKVYSFVYSVDKGALHGILQNRNRYVGNIIIKFN